MVPTTARISYEPNGRGTMPSTTRSEHLHSKPCKAQIKHLPASMWQRGLLCNFTLKMATWLHHHHHALQNMSSTRKQKPCNMFKMRCWPETPRTMTHACVSRPNESRAQGTQIIHAQRIMQYATALARSHIWDHWWLPTTASPLAILTWCMSTHAATTLKPGISFRTNTSLPT